MRNYKFKFFTEVNMCVNITINRTKERKLHNMKSEIMEIIFKLKEYDINKVEENSKYKRELEKIINNNVMPLHLKDIIKLIKESEKFDLYTNSMDGISKEIIYKSELHGISHNERVSIFAYAIGLIEELTDKDLKILLEAAKYHDIGRIDDTEDELHGKRSSDKIDNLVEMPEEDLNILKTICICHSIEDSEFERVFESLGIRDIERCSKLVEILKDADALDRVRIKNNGLDTRYLRTESAKRMVPAAYELFEEYENVKNEIENQALDQFPNTFVKYGEIFSEEQLEFLQKQWTKFNRYKKYNIDNATVTKNEDGKVILKEGTLVHGTGVYNPETLKKISETGILSGDFIGIHEDGETYYCADFIRMKEDKMIEEMKDNAGGRIPLHPEQASIAFIINPSKEIEEFTNTDAYSQINDDNKVIRNLMNLRNKGVVQKYLSSDRRGEVAAIPVGIPVNCFSGILVGDVILKDEDKIKELITLFPNCYITSRTGQIIYEPKIEKTNEEGNRKIMLEKARLDIENSKLKDENSKLERGKKQAEEKYNNLMKIIDEKCPPEILAEIYRANGWTQGLPYWLEEKLKESNKDSKSAEVTRLKEKIEEQDLQISKLQKMLSKVLVFAEKVRNSTVGKIFFRKDIKSLPSGEEPGDNNSDVEK